MRTTLFIFASALFFICSVSDLSAQEAKKYDNPQWQNVVFVNYYPGKTGKAREIIDNYYKKAAAKAGTPTPALELSMTTGEYDYMLIWDIQGGIEALNWEISPNNIKWRQALNEIAGGKEKADAIIAEYQSYVQNGKNQLARKVN